MMDFKDIDKEIEEMLKSKELAEATREVDIPSRDMPELFFKIMIPEEDYNKILTKNLAASNLDSFTFNKVCFLKSVAKDFEQFRQVFCRDDIWVKKVRDSISLDAEITLLSSLGLRAKFLESIVTQIKRSVSEIVTFGKKKKEKEGKVWG